MRARTTLGLYLWKEWRDHRAVLVGMVLAVPLLLVVMGLALPRTALDGLDDGTTKGRVTFAGFAALACLALFVVSLATDLVPGEARRGHRWFLERLPGGLGAAFRAKLLLFAGGAALFSAYGYLAGAITCRLVAGQWPAAPSPGAMTWVVAVVALWAFAVSCSLPRGALSLPAVAALAMLLAAPAALLWMLYPSSPKEWWRWESGALWAVGAVVAAWAAFRRRGFLRAGRACLVVGAVCAMPYWAHAGYGAYRWHALSVPRLGGGFLGEGGRYAFLNRVRALDDYRQTSVLSPVVVDLRTGVARETGSSFAQFRDVVNGTWYAHQSTPQRYVMLGDHSPMRADVHSSILDSRTAQPASPTEEEFRAAERMSSPLRLGDGRRAWLYGHRLEADTLGGGFDVLGKPGWSPCGTGLVHWNERTYFDLARGREYRRRKDLALRGERVWIRPGRWLAGKKGEHRLFDPDTNTFAPALGLGVDDARVIADDGRVFVRRGDSVALVDPETGVATDLALPPELAGVTVVEAARAFGRPTRTPDGRRVVLLYGPPGGGTAEVYWCAFARLDPGDRLATTAIVRGFTTLLGCANDDEAIVVVNDTLVRLRFGSDEREEIWRAR